ncbi:MAG: T9SS type A sorting domain-containing protein [Ignavibacteriales bacterium]|nr:T9SS type A sorting domain-containing protein [Ignavibacteriales bacterium]
MAENLISHIYKATELVSVNPHIKIIPDKIEPMQKYPNPFNPTTTISWQSPAGSWQTIKVFDLLGNEVATLVNEYKFAGSYKVEFNTNNLSSGLYIYQLKTDLGSISKKMLLIK